MVHFRISDFTDDSKPREKLFANGAGSLSDPELLAILIRNGTQEMNVLELANHLLKEYGGLSGLRKINEKELGSIRGIGPAKAAVILASIELGRRFSKTIRENEERQRIMNADDVYDYLHYEMENLDHEEVRILSLDSKHYLIGEDLLYRGTLTASSIRVAEIFKKPLLLNAASFVMVHNHPSGDPSPSAADIVSTRKILETGVTMDLPLLDHVIIGAGTFFSLKNYLTK